MIIMYKIIILNIAVHIGLKSIISSHSNVIGKCILLAMFNYRPKIQYCVCIYLYAVQRY